MALQDLAGGAFGYHNRADWLKTTAFQNSDMEFYQILEEARNGDISPVSGTRCKSAYSSS